MQKRGEPFFFWFALLLIAIVISGFSIAAAQKPGGFLGIPLHLHVHGAIFLGWFVLLAVQARLIAAGNVVLHRRLGVLSVLFALAIVIVGYLVTRGALMRPDGMIAGRPAITGAVFPVFDLISFTLAYILGVLNRTRADTHKRFMLLAAILMIDPAMARLVIGLGLPLPVILVAELGLLLSLIAYDVITRKRPHWASVFGIVLYALPMAVKLNVEKLDAWPGIVRTLFVLG
jgi:hypothetical protein